MLAYMIAGEASGDMLGASLMAGLRELTGDVVFDGIGGPLMEARGLRSHMPMEELNLFGIAEVLPKYLNLRRRLDETVGRIVQAKPDVLITIDSPDFCLRVAREVKRRAGVRTVHYVAPSVWAWRPGRAAKMAEYVDHVLALLPFEPAYMERAGMRCDFVGHPVISERQADASEIAEFRASTGIGDSPILLVLPGSRAGEVRRLVPVFEAAINHVLDRFPDIRIVVPAAESMAETVTGAVSSWRGAPVILDPRMGYADVAATRKRAAFGAADYALAASGTVSLELAVASTPTVIAYDMNWFSWQIMSRLSRIGTVTLVNLLTERSVIPEFLGPACRPDAIARALGELIGSSDARALQTVAMAEALKRLGQGGEEPGIRAARAVMAGLGIQSRGNA
ncbi:MAG: lipid-A-disaccharide synthase [Rhodobacter sp.]|nr:lipid-A-disaccharide synthase [Rhodobacter sp.]MCY4242474.1 lipid-A-disaccharide synthase [Rhodobacter sp.]